MRIDRILFHKLSLSKSRLAGLGARLQSLNPLNVLQRGYAIVSDEHGRIISSSKQVNIGDQIKVKLADGVLESEVKEINAKK
jgi:exodeoxyribonuclease VII large subunit